MYYRYQRPYISYGLGWTPMVKRLIIINAVIFLILLAPWSWKIILGFGLVPSSVFSKLRVWQFFTYMFLHKGFFHLLINMFVLWMFGGELERHWGSREFLKYYLVTGVGAGFFNWLLSMNSDIPVIGASGAIYGILVAYAMMFPNRIVYVFFLFPMRVKHLVMLLAAIALFGSWQYTSSGIAHLAHLGGMLVGFLYLKYGWRMSFLIKNYLREKREQRMFRVQARQERKGQEMKEQVDIILDKISKEGMDSLTAKERQILKRAGALFRKRERRND